MSWIFFFWAGGALLALCWGQNQVPSSTRNLLSANVTGTSISVHWSSQFKEDQTFQVTLSKASEVVHSTKTSRSPVEIRGLQPGVLYSVSITPCACGQEGVPLQTLVRTDAQTLDATVHLTNMEFTSELRNSSSPAYRDLSESFRQEIYQSLSPEAKAMVDSGDLRIEITGFSPGSVVVNFTIIFSQSQSQTMTAVTTVMVHSLMNSSKFILDPNNTSISDFDECTSGQNDCSPLATCANTWASYTCACHDGYRDYDPDRPGRTCQANDMLAAPPEPPTLFSGSAPDTRSPPAQTAITDPGITPSSTQTPTTSPSDITVPSISAAANVFPANTAAPLTAITTVTSTSSTVSTTVTIATSPTTPTSTSAALGSASKAFLPDALSVQCRVAAITVSVTRVFLLNTNIQDSALYLGMPGCGVNGGNNTHVQLTVAWDECGTMLVHNETFYTATVMLFNSMDLASSLNGNGEVPRTQLKVPIVCSFLKSQLISADFSSLGYDLIKDMITDLGSFPVTVQLRNGATPLSHNYSLSPEQSLVMEVSLNTTSEEIRVVMNKCWATPTQNPADSYSNTFLENSCPMNPYTKVLSNGNATTSRLSVQIFTFVSLKVIYLHCRIQICVQRGSDSCVPECFERMARSSNPDGMTLCTSGPVMRLNNGEMLEGKVDTVHIIGLSCLGVGLSLFFIVGFVCLFYYQRNRIGHYNFGTKPKQENFTYLAFST
ncbi:uromodulin-like 1 [Nothobranchius furzeri]|uniref:Uromodulin-like 1 n=1 Tax=Nothobranchius furzeri TaxID=105023 RepID=A0A8C6LAR5_NOTFU